MLKDTPDSAPDASGRRHRIKLRWLETFLIAATSLTFEAAGKELGVHPDTVASRITDLEQALLTPLIMTDPYFQLMEDGASFVQVTSDVLSVLTPFLEPQGPRRRSATSLLDLDVGDLKLFQVVISSRNRKDAADKLRTSESDVCRTIARIKKAVFGKDLFLAKRGDFLTPYGESFRVAAQQVVDEILQFEGRIRIKYIPRPTPEQTLASSLRVVQRAIQRRIAGNAINLVRLKSSKKGKLFVEQRRAEELVHRDFMLKTDRQITDYLFENARSRRKRNR